MTDGELKAAINKLDDEQLKAILEQILRRVQKVVIVRKPFA